MGYIHSVWFVPPNKQELLDPYRQYEQAEQLQEAQSFSVTLASIVVSGDHEGICRGDNDLLVTSRSSVGTQPRVERIHTFQEGVPIGKPIRNLFANSMFVTDDYSGTERLWLELNALEIDTDDGARRNAVQKFKTLARKAGAVYPALIPYTFSAQAVVEIAETILSAFEEDEYLVRQSFDLHPGETARGELPLQTGSYVVFDHQINEPEKYVLDQSGLVTSRNGEEQSGKSYAVFNVKAEHQLQREHVQSQKIATLLSQIRSGNSNTPKQTIEFLNETLEGYSNFKKLQRYKELKNQDEKTEAMNDRIKQIKKNPELQPFLPDEPGTNTP